MERLLLLIVVLISMDRLNSVAFSINGNLYFKINKTTIAQTRKDFMDFDACNLQDPPMPPNSVSVYHLDLLEKSKFKDYESLFTHRLTQDQARATYLVSELRQSRDKKGINDQILKATHVTYYQGHYVALFMIGSERIRNLLLIDTGSYLSWWQCAPCLPNKCYKQAFNAIYNYTTSTTFKHMDCVDESGCLNSVFRCNVDNRLSFPINENLYFKVNKTAIAQTRKAFMAFDTSNLKDPPMPPNSVSVYHLDLLEKSKFNDYDSLFTHRLAQDQARATFLSRRKSSVSNSSGIYDQILKATHVTYYQGHYVALFKLGSERVRNFLLIDTGNYLSWWQCEPCSPNKCYKQAFNAIYKYTESSTYKKLDCVAESGCLNSVFQCNVDSRLCFYTQTYDNGEKTIGFLATDIITFVGDNTQARITFGCGVNQVSGTGQFANTYSGIIALGKRLSSRNPGIYSLPSQLGSNLFALCLPTAEAATGSFLTFNKAPWVYGTEAKILKNRQEPHYYYVNLYKIFINDKEIPVDPTWWNGQKEDHGAFVDTGTLISRFPHDYYIIFRYAFRAQVHYPLYQHSIGGVFDTCYKEIEGEEEMQFPSVRLFFGNVSVTQELKLEQDRVVKNINGYYCLAFSPWDLKLTLIGTQQLQGTGLTFDMKNNVLTFSVDACD
ncbi:hypothetical protein CQW23_16208 [Capsicum baccatum]|uniref:Peptidase A1 domain-containing protein n=1 Tax=Capsicum baccatum TaxID=33114 RepID=A0A2G2WAC7_CAPBA|nr:hypothetical protein CQW23_16208 [Capsicum baccatum]